MSKQRHITNSGRQCSELLGNKDVAAFKALAERGKELGMNATHPDDQVIRPNELPNAALRK